MNPKQIQDSLFVAESAKYGDKYIEHLLEQYKTYISSAEKISDRRQKANEFFLALNSGLVAILGFVSTKSNVINTTQILLLASVAGITMCYFWYRMVLSYKGLNSAKFKVIHQIEARLPLALYDTEWKTLGEGKNKKIYWPFSHIEQLVPWIFIGIYLLVLVCNIPWCIFFH
jgi:hypothetical protein